MNKNCLWRDATRFDKNKPVAPLKKQLFLIALFLCASSAAVLIQSKILRKTPADFLGQSDWREAARQKISPAELRSDMCFNNEAMLGDVFQEILFRLLAFKWMVFEAKINVHVANVIQAVIFGFFHMVNITAQEKNREEAIQQSIASVFYFLLMGYLFVHTNSIITCCIVHVATNQTNCLVEVAQYAKFRSKHKKIK